jgi:TRAP-type C4-dicarboxylate transport system substrate-binding protein
MTLTRRSLFIAGLATPALINPARAQARWQMTTAFPDSNFHTRNNRLFIEEVQNATQGRVQIQLHPNGSLMPMPQIKRGVQQGQAQIGEILLSAYGNEDPFFEIDGIPQLAATLAQGRRLNELSRPYIEARFQRQGLSLLHVVAWPNAGFFSNVTLDTIEALRGTRFRTFSAMTNRFAVLVGANPTLIQAAEVPQAFATGVVNAMVTSASTGVDSAAWDFARVYTPVGFTRSRNAVFINRRALEGLSPADQAAIRAAAVTAEARGWQMSEESIVANEATLARRGMNVARPTPALLEALERVSQELTREWIARAGEDGARVIAAYRG